MSDVVLVFLQSLCISLWQLCKDGLQTILATGHTVTAQFAEGDQSEQTHIDAFTVMQFLRVLLGQAQQV